MRGWLWHRLMALAVKVDPRRSAVYAQSIGQQYLELYAQQVHLQVSRAIMVQHQHQLAEMALRN